MLPLSTVFRKFPRMVRDWARSRGKEVDFEIIGEETELDKSVIEQIGDPLVHLLRNAIDHGIENPDERKKKGKRPEGTLVLTARHEGNSSVITVQDDGRGIDPDEVSKKAIQLGLVSESDLDSMGRKDRINLIFHPGFSTLDEATDASGRGVGMDVVKNHIRRLNGLIDINTEADMGTTFTIRIPLTMAIVQCLMVGVGNEIYAIPLQSVTEIVRITPQEVKRLGGEEVINLRDEIIPLIRLSEQLQASYKQESERKSIYIVIIGLVEKRFGFVVERLLGQQELVIKSLGDYLRSVGTDGLAGATVSGEGKVILILDSTSIVEKIISVA
jgi:two-component system chemotaxis sensor kinase CheA